MLLSLFISYSTARGYEGTRVRGYATTQQGRARGKVQTEDALLTVVVFAAQHSNCIQRLQTTRLPQASQESYVTGSPRPTQDARENLIASIQSVVPAGADTSFLRATVAIPS